MLYKIKCIKLYFRKHGVNNKLWHIKFQNITYFQIQNSSYQINLFLQLNSKWSVKITVTCYELSTKQKSSSLLSNRAAIYRKADKKAASSHCPHSITMHAVFPSFLRRGLFDGSTNQFLARDWQNRTRTAAITVVCDYLSPNKSDPPVWSTHTHAQKKSFIK